MAKNASDPMHDARHRPALVLRTGDAIPEVRDEHGEFARWIARATADAWPGAWAEHDARGDEPLPDPRDFAAVVVTGSSSSVTERAPWMLRTEGWLRETAAHGTSIFGICFGHQLLGQAFGGEVRRNPNGREIGTVELRVSERDALLDGLPARFLVNATHVDTVAVVPPAARVVGHTALEANAILAIGDRVRGVQFHPEIDATVMRGYVRARRQAILDEKLDADAIHDRCADTPDSEKLLRNFFVHFVHARMRRAG